MTTELELPSATPLIDQLAAAITTLQVTAHQNHAVERCARAYLLLYAEARACGNSDTAAKSRASDAYRLGLPPLSGSRNVRDFIACVTHGMLIRAIDRQEASELLQAAKVAHTARESKSKPRNTAREQGSRPQKKISEPDIGHLK